MFDVPISLTVCLIFAILAIMSILDHRPNQARACAFIAGCVAVVTFSWQLIHRLVP